MKHKYWNILQIVFSIFAIIIFYFIPLEYIGEKYPICLYRIILKHECLGCGTTRATSCILHGDFICAYNYNKLIVFTFPLMVICYISWLLKKIRKL